MKQVAVVGAGIMGKGIAYAFAVSGYTVMLNDVNDQILQAAKTDIEQLLDRSYNNGFINEETISEAKMNMIYESDLESAVKHVNLVVEAVLEKIELKIDIFKKLDHYCKRSTILATNTSTMSPTEIAAQTNRPEKVVAMHFFNPVHKMKLIEVVRGLETSDETVDVIKEVSLSLGKEAVEVNELPGFVTSRMNCLIGNEAMNMLMEGVASAADIDKAMKLGLNHPMGPLELADLVGLDSRLRNMEYLYQTLGEKYRPSPLLTKYVKAGRLGKKSGIGFYDYR
ncbi:MULTISPECIES: 3-hydroxyacyl-CoA dehydrogenase NAD-binding domain-containing protein [Virgibacillus]|uniref:3-hydroxybutyryl-CoA dehydrogenase n=2 Tax=Virgibacillus TaxID=84406 RepID=A0ABQ2DU22_9BACI|nr:MULTISPECIES: 3-hydroxyacyl-CoA dehydrogenase NAD-binding domain-containing protein [Virgibacillus]EQB38006.1 3-hydroxybutyryl-CoA dehydrogenase [Virgibacillus sp. CM-4]MYL40724.1 3-hydroxyacyl-CoA dehydrogenase [Virgibacillus massiliensis]GGJ72619.1 3-hydroxybutyryl-CoA dehydrogenase [Virgibacillus kapii]CDQ38483.1 putative 3-hydroxybutyryl-CoA dehydrogenase [Virgibacillus massiliensis]